MNKLLSTACVVAWISVAGFAVADVGTVDDTVNKSVQAVDQTIQQQLGKSATTASKFKHGAQDQDSVRANQVKQMDLMQGDRNKTVNGATGKPQLQPLSPQDRDYLNLKPNATTYLGTSGKYATSVNLPSKFCTDITATTTAATATAPAKTTYACTGTSGFKGVKSSSDSAKARKDLVVDFSTKTKNDILEEIGKASELYAQRVAIYQAMAQEAYYRTTIRYNDIQQYLDDIKNSTDPKDVLDLQARIQSEQVMLQNEQNQLLALGQLQQSERDMYEQKKIELNSFRKNHDNDKNSTAYTTGKAAATAGITLMNTGLMAAGDSATVNGVLAGAGAVAAFTLF